MGLWNRPRASESGRFVSKLNKFGLEANTLEPSRMSGAALNPKDLKHDYHRLFEPRTEPFFSIRNTSTTRPKRMFTLTSLQGSTIPSRSNSNIRPEALKRWPWEVSSSGFQIAQRVPVEGSLYSRAVHEIRFSCEVVGPAGLYSVRVVSDVFSRPIIAQSSKFPVSIRQLTAR